MIIDRDNPRLIVVQIKSFKEKINEERIRSYKWEYKPSNLAPPSKEEGANLSDTIFSYNYFILPSSLALLEHFIF